MSLFLKILSKILPSPKLPKLTEEEKARFMEKYADLGQFSYLDCGFSFQSSEAEIFIKWAEIKKIVAYKRDLLTYDLICIALYLPAGTLEFNEETPGWYQFINKLKQAFPEVPENWEGDVMFPPFKTNETVLFSSL